MKDAGSFWARRRASVRVEAEAEAQAALARQEQARAEELAEKDDAEVLAELGLPEPSSMQAGDDFSTFMARNVPEHLRRQALRTLWRSNPVLACVDGLNDYDDDFRADMLQQGPVKTAYKVGRGMMRHIEEMERKAERAVAADDTLCAQDAALDDTDMALQDMPERTSGEEAAEETRAPSVAAQETPEISDQADAEVPVASRRMRFHFGGDAA